MLHDARVPGGKHGPNRTDRDGVWGSLPTPGRARKICNHAGRTLRGARPLRRRLGPLRGGGTGTWDSLPATERALRDARGDGSGSPTDVERRARRRAYLRGETLQARTPIEPAAEHEQAPSADHDRRRRGEEDPAPGRALRRRLQPASGTPGAGKARRVTPALRARRYGLRIDREDLRLSLRRRPEGREGRRDARSATLA